MLVFDDRWLAGLVGEVLTTTGATTLSLAIDVEDDATVVAVTVTVVEVVTAEHPVVVRGCWLRVRLLSATIGNAVNNFESSLTLVRVFLR